MEAVDQLASAGTFRVVKEPLAFLRVLEWIQHLHELMKQMQKTQIAGMALYEDVDNIIPDPNSVPMDSAFGGRCRDSLKVYGEMRAEQ